MIVCGAEKIEKIIKPADNAGFNVKKSDEAVNADIPEATEPEKVEAPAPKRGRKKKV